MPRRVPLPNGTTVWVSAEVDATTMLPPAVNSSSWVAVKKITTLAQSGGDERFGTYTPLGNYEDVRKPNGRNPIDIQLGFQDDADSSHQSVITAARDARRPLAWKYDLPNGAKITYVGFASGGLLPTLDRNNLMVLNLTIAVQGTPRRIPA